MDVVFGDGTDYCLQHPSVLVHFSESCWGKMKGFVAKYQCNCRCGGSHFTSVTDVHRLEVGGDNTRDICTFGLASEDSIKFNT